MERELTAILGFFAFGLGASSKWTCFYSGAGLAVLYFGDLFYNLVAVKLLRFLDCLSICLIFTAKINLCRHE